MEDEPPVEAGELRHFLGDDADVVADEDEGDLALAVQVVEHRVEGGLRLRIDAARGLVEDDQLGVGHERAGDQDALLLTRRERADPRARVRFHACARQRLAHARSLRSADALEEAEARHEPGGDHLLHGHGQGRVERGPLGDIAQPPPLPECRRRLAEEPHRAFLGHEQPQHDAQERGLARAVGADDAEKVAGLDGQVDAVEHADFTVGDADALELDEGTHQAALCLASHQAPAAAQEEPRRKPPSTSDGQ